MNQYKTEAIILDTTDVFDADRSFLLFTRELGKIRARARGVRKPTSRLTGHLLAYLPTELELIESGGNLLIVQAFAQRGHGENVYPDDPMLFATQAGIAAEALNRLFIERDPHPGIYEGLAYTLDRLRMLCTGALEGVVRARLVTAEFLMKSLVELGYRPELQRCVVTGEGITEKYVAWSSRLGGVLTEEGKRLASEDSFRLNYPRTVVVLRQLVQPQFTAERLAMPPEVQEEAIKVVYHYLQTQIGQPLRSLS